MLRYLLLSTGAILLFGCQANNPYQAQGLPLPAAPAAAATHFDVLERTLNTVFIQ